MAKAERTRRDMAEELSRQLEDILSTYCRESLSDDTLPNGQLHSPEFNGVAGNKPGEGKAIGANREERESRRSQEKKKVKGLGKKLSAS